MTLYRWSPIITIVISLFMFSNEELSFVSFRQNPSNVSKLITKRKIKTDMLRIRHTLEPLRSLFDSRHVYRKHYDMLKTLWVCCPSQRMYMFDITDMHQTIIGRSDCYNSIRDNKNHLTNECLNKLKLFDPTREDVAICDGRLLRNIADTYAFTVQLSSYTERWCNDGLFPMLIYFNITQIIQCERAIRQRLKNDSQAYFEYDVLSSNLLHIYAHNLHNYRDCDDPQFWNDSEDEQIDLSTTIINIGDHCG